MLGQTRAALLVLSLLPVVALLIVGAVMLSNASVTLANFVPGFVVSGMILAGVALLVWLIHL